MRSACDAKGVYNGFRLIVNSLAQHRSSESQANAAAHLSMRPLRHAKTTEN